MGSEMCIRDSDKNMNALDYQKRNLINEDYWGRENDNQTKEDFK